MAPHAPFKGINIWRLLYPISVRRRSAFVVPDAHHVVLEQTHALHVLSERGRGDGRDNRDGLAKHAHGRCAPTSETRTGAVEGARFWKTAVIRKHGGYPKRVPSYSSRLKAGGLLLSLTGGGGGGGGLQGHISRWA